jgi:anthranilate phosphoribosyltransferase
MKDILEKLSRGEDLTEAEARSAFGAVLGGACAEAEIGALLGMLATKGATVDELVGAARVMRDHVEPTPVDDATRDELVDTCGTGGAPKTFNISTAAAIVAAAAGALPGARRRVRVAKHGNRSRTGRGSAEILAELGVDVDATPELQARCLEEAGVCFCFAMRHHPAMRHAAGPRKALGFATIFNLLGPLTNPAGARRQLLGVYARDRVELVAGALARLGAERAMVVHGEDGLDEMTTTAPTVVGEVSPGCVGLSSLDAADFGVERATLDDLRATDLGGAAAAIRSAIAGEPGPRADIVAWNAAGALVVGGAAADLGEGLALAREATAGGRASRTLETLAALSRNAG